MSLLKADPRTSLPTPVFCVGAGDMACETRLSVVLSRTLLHPSSSLSARLPGSGLWTSGGGSGGGSTRIR